MSLLEGALVSPMIYLGPPEAYEGMIRDPVPHGGYPPLRRRRNPESDFNEEHWPKSRIPTAVCQHMPVMGF